ncbi:MAG: hypothetical protein Q8N15_03485, partial [Bacillota bacterium]|nr:hypothetical protein [Bacillota bacterium]
MAMTPQERKIAHTRYFTFGFMNFFFRMIVPVLIAGFVWGFIDLTPDDFEDAVAGVLVSASEFEVDGEPVIPDEDAYYLDIATETIYMFYEGMFVSADLTKPSFLDNVSAGVFVALLVFGTEIKDQLAALVEDMKQRKKWVFLKNRTFVYLLAGMILLFAYVIAKD